MSVLALTILVSSCLGGLFIVCFALEVKRARRSSPERDSLLPLDSAPIRRKPEPSEKLHHPSLP